MVKIYEILEGMDINDEDYVYDMFKNAKIFDMINDEYLTMKEDTNDFSGEPEDWYNPYEVTSIILSIRSFYDIVVEIYPDNKVISGMCEYMLNYLEHGIS